MLTVGTELVGRGAVWTTLVVICVTQARYDTSPDNTDFCVVGGRAIASCVTASCVVIASCREMFFVQANKRRDDVPCHVLRPRSRRFWQVKQFVNQNFRGQYSREGDHIRREATSSIDPHRGKSTFFRRIIWSPM